MDNSPDLPDSESELYELATGPDVDPYRREAAITKLAEFESEESTSRLEQLTNDGVSAIERKLAENRLSSTDPESPSNHSVSPSPVDEVSEESSNLEQKLQQDNETLRDTLRSTNELESEPDSDSDSAEGQNST